MDGSQGACGRRGVGTTVAHRAHCLVSRTRTQGAGVDTASWAVCPFSHAQAGPSTCLRRWPLRSRALSAAGPTSRGAWATLTRRRQQWQGPFSRRTLAQAGLAAALGSAGSHSLARTLSGMAHTNYWQRGLPVRREQQRQRERIAVRAQHRGPRGWRRVPLEQLLQSASCPLVGGSHCLGSSGIFTGSVSFLLIRQNRSTASTRTTWQVLAQWQCSMMHSMFRLTTMRSTPPKVRCPAAASDVKIKQLLSRVVPEPSSRVVVCSKSGPQCSATTAGK